MQNPGTVDATGDIATESKQDDIVTAVGLGADFYFNVVNGLISGSSSGALAGNNPGVAVNNEESVNNIRLETGTGAVYTYLTANTTVYVSSSSASDTQTVALVGLDATYTEVVRVATLTGQTPVAFSGSIFRVLAIAIISSPNVAAIGNIYVSTDNADITDGVPNTLSKVVVKMDTGFIQGVSGNRTVPLNKKAYLFDFLFNTSKSTDAEISIRFRSSATDDFAPAPPFQIFQNSATITEKMGITVPEKTDIDFTAKSPTAGSKITASISIIFTDV